MSTNRCRARAPWPRAALSPTWPTPTACTRPPTRSITGCRSPPKSASPEGCRLLAYTYSHAIDNASQDTRGGPQNARNLRADRGDADFDVRQRLVLSWSYELPFGRGRRYLSNSTGLATWIFGGWQINSIETFMTGAHFTPSSAQNTLG